MNAEDVTTLLGALLDSVLFEEDVETEPFAHEQQWTDMEQQARDGAS